MQAIEAYRKGGFTELVLEGKREYVALYNYGTTFWQGRNRADYPSIAKELKINLKDVATYFHAEAQKTKKADQFLEAARWYRTYLESFPDDPESFGTNYLLSETLYSAGDFQGASAEFTKTAYNYPRNARSDDAAYAALGFHATKGEAGPSRKGEACTRPRCDAASEVSATPGHRIHRHRALTRAAGHLCDAGPQRAIEVSNLVLAHQPPTDQPSAASRTPSSASRTSTCCSPGRERLHRGARACCRTTRWWPISPSASPRRCIARPRPSEAGM
jgi:tetratricopeptide (TPR) repeat protein